MTNQGLNDPRLYKIKKPSKIDVAPWDKHWIKISIGWYWIIYNGLRWYSMVFNGIQWYLIVFDGI